MGSGGGGVGYVIRPPPGVVFAGQGQNSWSGVRWWWGVVCNTPPVWGCVCRSRPEFMERGLVVAKAQQSAIVSQVQSFLDMNQIISAGPFLYAFVQQVSGVPARCGQVTSRGGTIPEITMRYVSRYLSHDTLRITILH